MQKKKIINVKVKLRKWSRNQIHAKPCYNKDQKQYKQLQIKDPIEASKK